jgi:flagellar biosynthesis/type III secretory pathway protein FliH
VQDRIDTLASAATDSTQPRANGHAVTRPNHREEVERSRQDAYDTGYEEGLSAVRETVADQSAQLLSTAEVAEYTGIEVVALRCLRAFGIGPAYSRIDEESMYRRDDVDAWLRDSEAIARDGRLAQEHLHATLDAVDRCLTNSVGIVSKAVAQARRDGYEFGYADGQVTLQPSGDETA